MFTVHPQEAGSVVALATVVATVYLLIAGGRSAPQAEAGVRKVINAVSSRSEATADRKGEITMANNKGYSHVNLATLDLDGTREFYESVLEFPVLAAGIYKVTDGGHFRHMQFDIGDNQMLSFLEANDIPGIPERFETDLNSPLGLPPAFNHLAFGAGSLKELEAKREELMEKGVPVTEIVDHDWNHSIYLDDPVNGLKLEYCCITRELRDKDKDLAVRLEMPLEAVKSMMQPTTG